jgi:hypothetical protein
MPLLSGIFLLGVGYVVALVFSRTTHHVQSKLRNFLGVFAKRVKNDELVDNALGASLYTR